MAKKAKSWQVVLLAPLIFVIILIVLPFITVFGIAHAINGIRLKRKYRAKWGTESKFVLLVYSESPVWQEYIEENIVPKLQPNVVLLNWSERAEWRSNVPLEAKVMRYWGGSREFNPLAIVFPKRGKVETIRFYQAFKDYKHGNDKLLKEREDRLFHLVSKIRGS